MKPFGDALKEARISKRFTLREVAQSIGKTIGYISDIENNRRGALDLGDVQIIENLLDINDGSLSENASFHRNMNSNVLARKINAEPQYSYVLMRAEEFVQNSRDKNKAFSDIFAALDQLNNREG